MSGWRTVSLGDFADSVDYGVTASASQQPSGPKFLRITDIQNGEVNWETVPWCECDARSAANSRLKPGDIVFARTGATTGKSFLIRECPDDAVFASYLIRVRVGNSIEPCYLSHFFSSPDYWAQITQSARGVAQPGVNASTLKTLKIPLPPLPEQKRIAAILDKADSIRRKRQEAVRLTEELLRSVFLEMFGDPVENAKNWPLMPMGLAIRAIETGWSANSEDRLRLNGEWAVLKISSVTSGRFLSGECKVVAEGLIDRELLTPKRGDLLFSRANTRELVAATCLVEQDEPKLFLPDKLWKIIPDEKITCTEYLRYLLAHPGFREKLTKQATGTSGSMLNISQAKVRGIEMPVPPIRLQKEFATFVWRNYSIRNNLETAFQSGDTLFNSLLQRAFKGEL
ncbi:MAG: restriction endonuclease subunit S [Geobacter sp.]|nr:restriction endonuclease subunit S [Geobacter sp.]